LHKLFELFVVVFVVVGLGFKPSFRSGLFLLFNSSLLGLFAVVYVAVETVVDVFLFLLTMLLIYIVVNVAANCFKSSRTGITVPCGKASI
jgi:hypothetical protein